MVSFGSISTMGRPGMALNIKDQDTEKLAAEVAAMAGESNARRRPLEPEVGRSAARSPLHWL